MYKVLDLDGKKIIVDIVDITKHRHVSWRDFIKEDGFNKIVKTVKPTISKTVKTEIKEEVKEVKKPAKKSLFSKKK